MAKRTFKIDNASISSISSGISQFLNKKYNMASNEFHIENGIQIKACDDSETFCCLINLIKKDSQHLYVEIGDLHAIGNGLKDTALSVLFTIVSPWIGVPYAGLSLVELSTKLNIPNTVFSYLEGFLSFNNLEMPRITA